MNVGHKYFSSNKFVIPVTVILILGLLLSVIILRQSQDKRSRAAGEPPVIITGVALNNSSAKITFQRVAGAVDYRVYDVTEPNLVKYAGHVHVNGTAYPSEQIEWNLLGDGQSHTLIIEAVDMLGPIPRGNQYNENNQPFVIPRPEGAMSGANAGTTPDGKFSINGQGESTNAPRMIAQSLPFVVRADQSIRSIPSGTEATQTFYDTFDNSEAQNFDRVGNPDPALGNALYTLSTGQTVWNIIFQGVDTENSMPFIADSHFMDMIFDGGTPGITPPLHSSFGLMSLNPRQTVDFSNGRIVHLTQEVDAHFSQNRWASFELSPADDPLTNWNPQNRINATNRGIFVEITDSCTVDFYTGSVSLIDSTPRQNRLIGSGGRVPTCTRTRNGIALDNKSRFDLFFDSNHLALFEDGVLLAQADIPTGWLDFQQAQAYYSHYNTRSAAARQGLVQQGSTEDFWITKFPYSDERHWDNMGYEVLPQTVINSSDWRALVSRIRMPVFVQPMHITPTISISPTITQSISPTVTPTPIVNPTLNPTNIPTTIPQPGTGISLNLLLHGIGAGGDNANPRSGGNTNPVHPQRSVSVELHDTSNHLMLTKNGTVNFNSTTGNFTGTIDMGTAFTSGTYTVKVKTGQFLKTIVPGIQSVTVNSTNQMPQTVLVNGDINGDNILNILDFNILMGCYSDTQQAVSCTPANKLFSDTTDDNSVNQIDYNLFLRELTNVHGE